MNKVFLKFKKAVSVAIACSVCILSLTAVPSMNASAVNNCIMIYKVYDAATASYISSYQLTPSPRVDNSRSVILPDERVVDFTKSGVVKIMGSTDYIGSGFVVDAHTIATSAHCAYNKQISGIRIFNSNGNIALTATPVQCHIPNLYVQTQGSNYDYALITVEEDLSDYACFNLGVAMGNFLTSSKSVCVTGFPRKVNDVTVNGIVQTEDRNNMYTGVGTVTGGNECVLNYNVDISEGNSGGPVYTSTSYNGNVYYTVIAIHTADLSANNYGTRINTNLMHFYKNNPNISY